MPGRVTLKVEKGPIRGQVFTFDEHDTFIFGRSPDCHARLPEGDRTASRHHFILEVNPPDACIRDLGSLNGTYVQRDRIEETVLRPGDEVQIGKYRMVFHPSPRDAGAGAGW